MQKWIGPDAKVEESSISQKLGGSEIWPFKGWQVKFNGFVQGCGFFNEE